MCNALSLFIFYFNLGKAIRNVQAYQVGLGLTPNMLMALDVEMNLLGENIHPAKHRTCIAEISQAQEQANVLYSRQYHQVRCTVRIRQILKYKCVLCSHFPIYTRSKLQWWKLFKGINHVKWIYWLVINWLVNITATQIEKRRDATALFTFIGDEDMGCQLLQCVRALSNEMSVITVRTCGK
jgi:hypothetical protein